MFKKRKETTTAVIVRAREALNNSILLTIRQFETEHGVSVAEIQMSKIIELHSQLGFTQKLNCRIALL